MSLVEACSFCAMMKRKLVNRRIKGRKRLHVAVTFAANWSEQKKSAKIGLSDKGSKRIAKVKEAVFVVKRILVTCESI
jgi:hypothetical protein